MNSDSAPNDPVANDYVLDVLGEIYRIITKGVAADDVSQLDVSVFPNPSADHFTFAFRTTKESMVKLLISNELGEEITTIIDEELAPGFHHIAIDSKHLHLGTYFYRLQTIEGIHTGKIFIN
jgi:hypothetical protein